MKYCINCGHVLPDFANFCPICGQKQFPMEEETQAVNEEPSEVVIPAPVVEEPVVEETPIIEEIINEEPQQKIEEVIEEPVQEEIKSEELEVVPVAEVIQEENSSKETSDKKEQPKNFVAFIESNSSTKQSLIFLGVILGLSLIFWLLSLAVNIGTFFRVILFIYSIISLARIGFILYLEIKKNKLNNLFDLMLKGTFTIAHLLLLILNFIWMVS